MKTITITTDCGAIGEQDLQVDYEGGLDTGVVVKGVKIHYEELIDYVLSKDLDQLAIEVEEKLEQLRVSPPAPKDWLSVFKTIIEE